MAIKPAASQAVGLVVSAVVGYAVCVGVGMFLKSTLDFYHVGEILGLLAGIPLGTLAAYQTFVSRRLDVKIGWVGVGTLFGSLIEILEILFDDGRHWVPWFVGILMVPGPAEKLGLEIPGEEIEAKDEAAVYFGVTENGGKANQIQYSVLDPLRFIVVEDFEKSLCREYMGAARTFFGQATKAAEVRSQGNLFLDFLMLPSRDATFEDRLRTTGLFDDDAISVLMEEAGKFLRTTASWGIGNIIPSTPNVRSNPAVQAAAEKRKIAEEEAAALKVKMTSISEHAKEMKGFGATPDLALVSTMKMSGEDIDIVYRNVPEYMGMMGMPSTSGGNQSTGQRPRKAGRNGGQRQSGPRTSGSQAGKP